MTFDEIPLYEAVHDVRIELDTGGEMPGSDVWPVHRQDQLCRLIQARVPMPSPYSISQMLTAWMAFRKRGEGKADLIVAIARTHGRRCFWKGRGLGNCCDVVSIDRLVPETRGGAYSVENCVLSCRTHNSARGDKSIEDFLLMGEA